MDNYTEIKNTELEIEDINTPAAAPLTEAVETQKEIALGMADAETLTADSKETPPAEMVDEAEFNWGNETTKRFGDRYNDKEREELAALYGDTVGTIEEKKVVPGTVASISERDVIINIGFKSDGLVSKSEFRDLEELKIGDPVEVYVETQEDGNGQLVISRRKAKIVSAWEKIQKSADEDLIIDGMVKRRTKGGLIVDIFGIEAFLPGSQIDVKPIRDFDIYVGKKIEVKVVKINHQNSNVVVSHKILIEKDLEEQKIQILENLEKGQVLEGVIKNMTIFGVFIDLGGVDGLLHITDISWTRISHPEEVLSLDQKVNVVVLDFDDEKKRISLGMKQLTQHPWDALDPSIEENSRVKGKVVNVADYGAFLELQKGVEGLVHVSEMSWSQHLRNPQDFLKVGDELEVVVLTIDREERKMSLGIKQLTEDPWSKPDLLTKYAVGTEHKGIVRNLTHFGLFLELEEGIDGLVHVSDLSWTKRIKHPSDFVKSNEELEVKVLDLDIENKRLALGHKQLEENPWDTFGTIFSKGSIHKCTVTDLVDKGAILELPYGLEEFVSTRNIKKKDGSKVAVGETLDFMVTGFSKEEKKITLSHTATYAEEGEKYATEKQRAARERGMKKVNAEVEKSTLGDLDALSALKEKMNRPKAKAETPSKPKKGKAKTPKKEAAAAPDASKEEVKTAETKAANASDTPKEESKPEESAHKADSPS